MSSQTGAPDRQQGRFCINFLAENDTVLYLAADTRCRVSAITKITLPSLPVS